MAIYCVSDLHLGDRGARDNFCVEGREDRFLAFLDHVEASRGKLYILGDLFDWWQVNLSRSVMAYWGLLRRFDALGATWVVGNHDGALAEFIGEEYFDGLPAFRCCRRAFEQTIGGRRFAFLHGHEADPYCRDANPGAGELTAILSAMLEDRHRGPVDRRGRVLEDRFVGSLERVVSLWRWLNGRPGRLEGMVRDVEEYRVKTQADVVIYGHTHEPGRMGDYHYNAGCWCREKDTFVQIEDDATAGVFEWTRSLAPAPLARILPDPRSR